MGCLGNKQVVEESKITPKQLTIIIDLAQAKCKVLRKLKLEASNIKKNEIFMYLRQNNRDLAIKRGNEFLKEENEIAIYDTLNPFFDILKTNSSYIISSNECPADLRAPLDSIIYSSNRLEIDEFKQFREIITEKYGSTYVKRAENNSDKFVNRNLVDKFQVTDFTEEVIQARLNQILLDLKKMRQSNVKSNTNINKNPNASMRPSLPNQKLSQKNSMNINPVSKANMSTLPPNRGSYPNVSQVQKPSQIGLAGKGNQQVKKDNPPKNPNISQKQVKSGISGQGTTNNAPVTNKVENQIEIDPSYIINLPPNFKIDNKEEEKPKWENIDILGGETAQTMHISENPTVPQQNIGNNNVDVFGGDTAQTMHISVANPDNKQNPYLGEINEFDPTKMEDPLGGATLPIEEGDFNQLRKEGGFNDPFLPGAKVDDPFGGNTLPLEEGNPNDDKQKGQIEEFDPTKMEDPLGGATLPIEEGDFNQLRKEGGFNDPFLPGAKVDDPFGGNTIQEGENNPNDLNNGGGANPFAPGAKIEDPFGGATL